MRIATYNVEWFARLFDDEGELLLDGAWSGRHDVKRKDQIDALGIVFTALNADAIMIIEAPDGHAKLSTERALENFARFFDLRTRKALVGFTNETQQEIALLYDPDVMTAVHDPQGQETGKKGASGAPRFDGVFRGGRDDADLVEPVRFSKPPLEAAISMKSGQDLRMIGVHVKSKAPHGAKGRKEIMKLSVENRRKQLAQCVWLRNRVEQHLKADESLIVLGDMNDGPGLDEYEKLFGRSGVEVVLGEDGQDCLYDPHAAMAVTQRVGAMPTTSRFYIAEKKRYFQALLDYIMVSADLRPKDEAWRIWHPFDDQQCYETVELREALLVASDHFPVTLDLKL